jgi:hypothetical protein
MGLLLPGSPMLDERPGLSRLARPRPRQANPSSPAIAWTRPRTPIDPDPRCLVSSMSDQECRLLPRSRPTLLDEVPDPKNYARPEKPMSVPVTKLFLQYVYIGGRVVSQSHRCPTRVIRDHTLRGWFEHRQGKPCCPTTLCIRPSPHTLPCSYAHRSHQRGPPPHTMP